VGVEQGTKALSSANPVVKPELTFNDSWTNFSIETFRKEFSTAAEFFSNNPFVTLPAPRLAAAFCLSLEALEVKKTAGKTPQPF